MLNTKEGPTAKKEIRQALNYAINREAITENLMQGSARAAGGPVPIGNPVYEPALEMYNYNPDKAKQLLAEAGVSNPLNLKILIPTSGAGLTIAPRVAAMMQQDLKSVGVEVTFESLEWAAFLAKAKLGLDKETAALHTGWTTAVQDPYWLERMFGAGFVPPKGANRAWYANPAVDEVLAQARTATDEETMINKYREAAQLIASDAPWIFLYQDRWPRAISSRVQGFVSAPSPFVDLTKVWLKQ